VRPYRRPALSRMASEEVSEVQFYIKPQAFYDENRIRLELGRTLTAFDPDVRQLKFDTGETESYDKLLLATGAHCFLPPVPGMELDGVMSLREYADLERLRARLDAGVGRVVVIGGGLLGLELAQSLLERGCEVTVVESCPVLLPRNLDEEAAAVVQAMLGKVKKLTLLFGSSVSSILGEGGRVRGVELPGALEVFPHGVVIGSYSKNLSLAGERLGYIAVSPRLEDAAELMAALILCNRILGFVNAPALAQQILMECMDSQGDLDIYRERRDAMASILSDTGIEFTMPRGAFYFFPKSPTADEGAFIQALLEERVLAVPGRGFGCPGYVRFAFCVDTKVIEGARQGVKNAVAKLG